MIYNTIVATVAAGLLASASAASAESLILSHGYAPSHVITVDWIEPWMTCVEAQGSVDFTYYPSGQVTKNTEALDHLETGLVNVTAISPGYYSDRMPLNGIVMLPTLGNSATQNVKAYRTDLDSGGEMALELDQLNLVPLMVHITPPYQVLSRGTQMDTLEALNNKKIRTSGSSLFMIADQLGAVPVEMPASDVYLSLQQGVVDGAMFAALSINPYSLMEVMKSMSRNADFGNSATVFAISKDSWNGFDEAMQAHMKECGHTVELAAAQKMDADNDMLLSEFSDQGVEIFTIKDEELERMNERLNDVVESFLARLEQRGLPARKVFENYRQVVSASK